VQASFTQPDISSFPLGSDAVNLEVFGHMGWTPGKAPSMAWWCTSITGGALGSAFCASETVEADERSAAQHRIRRTGPEGMWHLLLLKRADLDSSGV
jgi:hypothetical protein